MAEKQGDGPLLIVGKTGQVARALRALRPDAIALGRDALDLDSDLAVGEHFLAQRFERALLESKARWVVNAAAYTAVDAAENPTEGARVERTNSVAPGVLARVCREQGAVFIHLSTDYVFPGDGSAPWREDDPVSPLNAYGQTKQAGEQAVLREGGWVVRTAWVYDGTGRNFLTTMLRLGAEREELRVVNDQVGAPTYAPHLAAGLLALLGHKPSRPGPGLLHLCASGETSWFGFANQIFEGARARGISLKVTRVAPVASSEFPTPARRPLNSRLSLEKARQEFGIQMPTWEQGVSAALDEFVSSR